MSGSGARRRLAATTKLAVGTIDRARRPPDGVVILLYHRVGAGTGASIDQPPGLFEEQVAELAPRVVTLDRAVDLLTDGSAERPPAPPVVVTFDDGTRDFADVALPILVRHRVPATVYVATGFVDRDEPFPDGTRPLSWAALADAHDTGLVTIGSHTHDHRLLDRVDRDVAVDELDRSMDRIGEALGVEARHFAYPKALAGSPAAEAEVRRRFRSAALAGTAPNAYGATDVHRLRRSPIQVDDGMRWFRRKAAGGMALEDSLRRVLNRRRYAGATT